MSCWNSILYCLHESDTDNQIVPLCWKTKKWNTYYIHKWYDWISWSLITQFTQLLCRLRISLWEWKLLWKGNKTKKVNWLNMLKTSSACQWRIPLQSWNVIMNPSSSLFKEQLWQKTLIPRRFLQASVFVFSQTNVHVTMERLRWKSIHSSTAGLVPVEYLESSADLQEVYAGGGFFFL